MAASKSNFKVAKITGMFAMSPILQSRNNDKIPLLTSFMIIYQFKYTCIATYVGQTARRLSKGTKNTTCLNVDVEGKGLSLVQWSNTW